MLHLSEWKTPVPVYMSVMSIGSFHAIALERKPWGIFDRNSMTGLNPVVQEVTSSFVESKFWPFAFLCLVEWE